MLTSMQTRMPDGSSPASAACYALLHTMKLWTLVSRPNFESFQAVSPNNGRRPSPLKTELCKCPMGNLCRLQKDQRSMHFISNLDERNQKNMTPSPPAEVPQIYPTCPWEAKEQTKQMRMKKGV